MPDVLTTEQAAQYLQVSVETIKRHARRGWLPGAKVGKAWRFRKVDLDDWLSRGGTAQNKTQQKLDL